ncbi:MAG: hypothetical protein CGU28_14440 [Candidatus Dactylopiibacterium carminicum]|uniref:Cytochrome C n=1 Tax=Candidatus Dactylopiibacterium carminicum TaxID=857335 RepID=A0A272EQA9_9RHOO|nr:cytochrome c [Candidatus Dactylopiibacterium carminicum]KAF7598579.1 hypothetical protein BGI27_12540 [Candidatus Dactylopiibacterium carminicum]PAS92287.1 MAG: hypothetical protein CGU29_12210 [Candidatus Dactylopiibacterium carminicum]PAS93989.1 MAG: hypothetical protein CGU28_14440 [Candidatus Dactylopiibacterium carminicum]
MNIRRLLVFLSAALLTGSVLAQAKPEDQVKYRQSVMTVTGRSVGVLTGFAKGAEPFDQGVAARHAAIIAGLAEMPLALGAFGPGTNVGTHKASPKIWSEPDKFQAAYARFVQAAQALPAAAGEQKSLQVALGGTGQDLQGMSRRLPRALIRPC